MEGSGSKRTPTPSLRDNLQAAKDAKTQDPCMEEEEEEELLLSIRHAKPGARVFQSTPSLHGELVLGALGPPTPPFSVKPLCPS